MKAGETAVATGSATVAGLAAEKILEAIRATLAERPRCSVALAGGTTPKAAYEIISKSEPALLARIDFYFGDERCVAADDPDSNYRMARAALGAAATLHRIEGEKKDRDAAARAYEKLLPAALDVVILGIGEDGHTASLFPGSPALDEKTRRVVAVSGAPKPPPERITISPVAIESARKVIVIASGAGKAGPVQQALAGDWNPRKTPAQLARRGLWVLDAAAAALTSRSSA